jgi:adenylate kinase
MQIHLDVPDSILTERVTGRRLDPDTGDIYHLKFNPPPSPEVAKRLLVRSDDTEAKVKVRIKVRMIVMLSLFSPWPTTQPTTQRS